MGLRHTLMNKLATVQDVTIYDSTSINWLKFDWQNGFYTHRLTDNEILRFELVSFAYYGTVDYDEILLLLNGISDIWSVVAGTEIKIPQLLDLKKFIIANQK